MQKHNESRSVLPFFVICPVTIRGNTTGMEARRAHRPTVRGLASRLKSAKRTDGDAASTDSEECHVYSNRVAEVFNSFPQMPIANPSTSCSSPSGLYEYVSVDISVLFVWHLVFALADFVFMFVYNLSREFHFYPNFALWKKYLPEADENVATC